MGESSALGVTDYEFAALIGINDTPSGRRAADAIGIAALVDDAGAVRAGYTGLLVRGLAGFDDGLIVAEGAAAAIGTIATTADDILRLVLTHDGEPVGRTILVDAAAGCFLLDMTAYGVHAAQPLAIDTDLVALVGDVVAAMASGHPDVVPLGAEVTRFPVGGEPRTASVVVADDWTGEGASGRDAVWARVRAVLGSSDAVASSGARRGVQR